MSTLGALAVLTVVLLPVVFMVFATLTGDVGTRWAHLDGVILDRMVNSCVMALIATVLSLAIAVPLAICLHRCEFPGRRIIGVLYVAPLLIPPHIHAISWMRIFGNRGYITSWLKETFDLDLVVRAGFVEIGGSPTFFPGATWMLTACFWPLAALIVSAGLSRVDPRPEEAALVASGRRGMLRRVTLPMLRQHVLAGGFFVFIFAVSCYPIPQLLDTPTIMIEIFQLAANVDPLTAAVVSLPLVATTIGALIWITFSAGRHVWQSTASQRPVPSSLRPRSWKAFFFAWGAILITAGWPLFSLGRTAGAISNYRAIWKNVLPELENSLILSVVSAVVLAAAGTLVAVWASRLGRRRGFLVESLALIAFAFPAVVVGVATNVFWSRFQNVPLIDRWIYGGMGIAIFMYLMLFLPFAVRSVRTALGRVPQGATESAALAGRSPTAVFFRVVLPMIRPGIVAAFVLGFVLTLGELAAGLTVRPPDWLTAQVRIFNMIHFSRDEEVAALCVMVAAMALIPTALYALVFNRKVEVL